ncbi:DNA methyltransferase [Treponema sp.]|uniref:DNA methyltransferase n=1 Tax=Treponema sp. TaxID=166 RepID=UPI003F04B87A
MFDIPHPVTHKNCPKPENGWRWAEKTFWNFVKAGQVEWGKDHTTQPHIKKRIETATDSLRSIIYEDNRASTKLVSDLFNGIKVFDNPKPLNVLYRLIDFVTEKDDIILDFFSGSGTTAHSVLQLNVDKLNEKRKFIVVQLPENLDENLKRVKSNEKKIIQNAINVCDEIGAPHILSVIGQERIRRAAAKIKTEHPDTTADLGFKTYYLKSMPKETLDKIKAFEPNSLELVFDNGDIVKSLGEKTVLQTWQIKDGFGFSTTPKEIDLAGYTAWLLDDEKIGKYLYLLVEIEEKSIKELIRKIESLELTVDKIFIYGYSFDFNMLTSITTNLKTLKNRNPIEPIVRY